MAYLNDDPFKPDLQQMREMRKRPRSWWNEYAAEMLKDKTRRLEEETATAANAGGVDENRMKRERNKKAGEAVGTAYGTTASVLTGGAAAPLVPLASKAGGVIGDLSAQKNFLGSGDNSDLFRDISLPASVALQNAGQLGQLGAQAIGPMAIAANWDQGRRFLEEPKKRIERGVEKAGKAGKKVLDTINPLKW